MSVKLKCEQRERERERERERILTSLYWCWLFTGDMYPIPSICLYRSTKDHQLQFTVSELKQQTKQRLVWSGAPSQHARTESEQRNLSSPTKQIYSVNSDHIWLFINRFTRSRPNSTNKIVEPLKSRGWTFHLTRNPITPSSAFFWSSILELLNDYFKWFWSKTM